MTAPLSARRPKTAGATPSKETAKQRHARRVAWGEQWGAVGREHAQKIRQREGR